MLRYVTSTIAIFICLQLHAQDKQENSAEVQNDSLYVPANYGLRAGVDLSSIARSLLDDEYTGFEIMADYRVSRRWFAAAEIGTERLDRETNQIDFETSGSFITAGADYNFYRNWLDLENLIYVGFRAGGSSFDQTLNRFAYYQDTNQFEADEVFLNNEYNDLSALWGEIQAGIKVEVLNNLYMSLNVQLKLLLAEDVPDNFDNLYIPGFGRTYDTNSIGVGYSYGISYRIPFYKK